MAIARFYDRNDNEVYDAYIFDCDINDTSTGKSKTTRHAREVLNLTAHYGNQNFTNPTNWYEENHRAMMHREFKMFKRFFQSKTGGNYYCILDMRSQEQIREDNKAIEEMEEEQKRKKEEERKTAFHEIKSNLEKLPPNMNIDEGLEAYENLALDILMQIYKYPMAACRVIKDKRI